MYFVLEGKARMHPGEEEREVTAGPLLYVKAATEHSFFEIEEAMLVLFASGIQHQAG